MSTGLLPMERRELHKCFRTPENASVGHGRKGFVGDRAVIRLFCL